MGNKFFNSRLFYVLASVFFAIILFFNANATSIRNETGNNSAGEVYTATINNVPIELKYDTTNYFVSGYTSTATVHLSGYNRLSITNEENVDTRKFYLSMDLSKYKVGKVDVPVRIESLPSAVTATISPKTMNVTIEKKASEEFEVTPKVDPTQLPTGFTIATQSVNDQTVKVTAGKESITQIAAIVAALPSDVTLTDNYAGTVTLHAVDSTGKILPAQISPATTHLKVLVNKLTKKVPIELKTTGTLDKSLSEMKTKLSADTVTISGEESSLDAITKIPANISVTGVTKETKVKVPLSASGVTLDPKEIEVTLIPVKK